MQLSARARGFESLTLRHETFSKNHAVSVFFGIAWFFLFCPEQCSACKSSKTAGFYAVLQENATQALHISLDFVKNSQNKMKLSTIFCLYFCAK